MTQQTDYNDSLEKSTYNEANFNIMRINESWLMCRQYIRNSQYFQWLNELKIIWSEVVQDISDKRLSDHMEVKLEYIQMLTACVKALKSDNNSMKRIALDNLHHFLRHIQDRVGKGGKYDDGSGWDSD